MCVCVCVCVYLDMFIAPRTEADENRYCSNMYRRFIQLFFVQSTWANLSFDGTGIFSSFCNYLAY